MSRGTEEGRRQRADVAYFSEPEARARALAELVEAARDSIVLQMYLLAASDELITLKARPGLEGWARTFAGWLVDKRRRCPEVSIVVLLDTQTPDDPQLTRGKRGPLTRHILEEAGITVLNANLFETTFDGRERSFLPGAGFHRGGWREPHPRWVARQRRWQNIHNVEDHRKNLIIDGGRYAAVTSHNIIDLARDWRENLLVVSGAAAVEIFDEARHSLNLALKLPQRISDTQREEVEAICARAPAPNPPLSTQGFMGLSPARVRVLGGQETREAITARVEGLRREETSSISMASAYCSDNDLLETLFEAPPHQHIRLLIDDCAGLPLPRPMSAVVTTFVNLRCTAMARASQRPQIEVRQWSSRGREMMHLKSAIFLGAQRTFIGGQANYTPNSFSGAWLETDLDIESEEVVQAFLGQFEALWAAAKPVPGRHQAATRGPVKGAMAAARRGLDRVLLVILSVLEALGLRP